MSFDAYIVLLSETVEYIIIISHNGQYSALLFWLFIQNGPTSLEWNALPKLSWKLIGGEFPIRTFNFSLSQWIASSPHIVEWNSIRKLQNQDNQKFCLSDIYFLFELIHKQHQKMICCIGFVIYTFWFCTFRIWNMEKHWFRSLKSNLLEACKSTYQLYTQYFVTCFSKFWNKLKKHRGGKHKAFL
jgi:hypothetical protein